jgi:polygalacturonase
MTSVFAVGRSPDVARNVAWLISAAFLVLTSHTALADIRPARTFDVRDYGAAGDGRTLDTAAIQKAVDACQEAGGGRVDIRGGAFLSGTIRLKSNVTLHVAAGATLRGSRDIADYPDNTPKIRYLYRPRFTKSLIYAEDAHNITLSGRGVIDGQGVHFPARPGDDKGRPYILRLSECRNVRVENLRFLDSARWLSHYLACENVVISGISIHSKIRENRDGIDIDSCSDVRISDCSIDTGDDSIVLKATAERPCQRVAITNCVLSSLASAIKLGTESNGGFKDITISNCVIHDTRSSGINVAMVDGGELDRVNISNVTMSNVGVPIFIRLGNRARPIPGAAPPGMGSLRNVTISNVQASGAGSIGCSISGIPGHPVENITLDSIRIDFAGGGTREDTHREIPENVSRYPSGKMFGTLPTFGVYCRHARNVRLHNLDLTAVERDERPAIVADDVLGLDIFSLRADAQTDAPTLIQLDNVRRALIHACLVDSDNDAFLHAPADSCKGILMFGNHLGGSFND